jgi:hypothetical protein
MVQLLNHSATFRDLIRDVFSGAQDYRSLKRRMWAQFGITVAEFTKSFVVPGSCSSSTCKDAPGALGGGEPAS